MLSKDKNGAIFLLLPFIDKLPLAFLVLVYIITSTIKPNWHFLKPYNII